VRCRQVRGGIGSACLYRLRSRIVLTLCSECVRELPSRALRSHIGTANIGLHRVLRSGQLFTCWGRGVYELPCGKLLRSYGRLDFIVMRVLLSRNLFNGCWRKLLGDLPGLRSRHVLDDGRRLEVVNLRELLDGLLHRDDGRHELHELPCRPVRRGLSGLVCELRSGHVPDELHFGELHGLFDRVLQPSYGTVCMPSLFGGIVLCEHGAAGTRPVLSRPALEHQRQRVLELSRGPVLRGWRASMLELLGGALPACIRLRGLRKLSCRDLRRHACVDDFVVRGWLHCR